MLELSWLITLHLIADFFLQSRVVGKNKSSNPFYMAEHLWIIFIVFVVGACWLPLKFMIVNTLIHGLVDATTWNVYKILVHRRIKNNPDHELLNNDPYDKKYPWTYWEDHWFYVTIGVDQWLHIVTIVLLYGWVS